MPLNFTSFLTRHASKYSVVWSFMLIQTVIVVILLVIHPSVNTYYHSPDFIKDRAIFELIPDITRTYYFLSFPLINGFFASIFVVLWQRILQLEQNPIIQKLTNGQPLDKTGILWIILGLIYWELQAILLIIMPIQLLSDVITTYLEKVCSFLNTSALTYAVLGIEFYKPPVWWNWRAIEWLRKSPFLMIVPILYPIIYTILYIYSVFLQTAVFVELIYSFGNAILMGAILSKMFADRGLPLMNILLYFTLFLLLGTQLSEIVPFFKESLMDTVFKDTFLIYSILTQIFPVLLLILLLAWAYTWVDFYTNKALKVLNSELMETNAALAAEKDRQIMLRAEMNHTNRGNLRNLLYDLSKLDIEPATNEALKNETIARIQHIYTLHSLLHDEQNSETHISLHTYIEKLIQTLKQSHKWTQFEYEIKGQDMLLNNKTLRDLGSILLEAAINAYKAYSNTQRKPNLWIKLSTENSYLQIEIIDEAGGIPVSAPTNFGSKQLAYLAEDLEGSIKTYNNDRSGATVAFQVEKEKLSIIRSNFSTNHQ